MKKQFLFTMAKAQDDLIAERHPHFGLFACGQDYTLGCKLAFTMAEILISLTIIGVIAAITLPALVANINEKAWTAQRKALYSRMSQAISMMPSLNGYGKYSYTMDEDSNVTIDEDTAAQAFVTDGLSKVFEIRNICPSTELSKCGITSTYTKMDGTKTTFPTTLHGMNYMFAGNYTNSTGTTHHQNPQGYIDTKAAGIETVNGESIAVFYNPFCIGRDSLDFLSESNYKAQPYMCVNFVYDLNGIKGPNQMGKDKGFITAFYPTDSEIAAPMPLSKNANGGAKVKRADAQQACRTQDKDSRMPNILELTAIMYNKELLGGFSADFFSADLLAKEKCKRALDNNKDGCYLLVGFGSGSIFTSSMSSTYTNYLRCLKR